MEVKATITTKNRLLEGALHYIFPLIMISILPILIQPLADKWGYWHYSSISELIGGIFLAVLWIVSLILFHIFNKSMKKKGIFTTFDGTDEMISTKSLMIASAIFFAMILMMSIKTGFKVKPFYDYGEKLTGFDFMNKNGILLKKAVRCAFIPVVCRGAYLLSGLSNRIASKQRSGMTKHEQPETDSSQLSDKNEPNFDHPDASHMPDIQIILNCALYIFLVLGYGVFEILYDHIDFPVIYSVFYISFAVLYLLMKKNYTKTFALSLLIYLL